MKGFIDMKAVILAGGLGNRIAEETEDGLMSTFHCFGLRRLYDALRGKRALKSPWVAGDAPCHQSGNYSL